MGEARQEEADYIVTQNVSWVMAKVMLMNAAEGVIDNPAQALEALHNIYQSAGRMKDCEGLERG